MAITWTAAFVQYAVCGDRPASRDDGIYAESGQWGCTLDREYAIGRDRIDLLVTYKGVRMAMELKIWRKAKNPIKGGLEQLDAYLSGLSLETGWLVIFDQRPESGEISERTSAESVVTPMGRTITLILA